MATKHEDDSSNPVAMAEANIAKAEARIKDIDAQMDKMVTERSNLESGIEEDRLLLKVMAAYGKPGELKRLLAAAEARQDEGDKQPKGSKMTTAQMEALRGRAREHLIKAGKPVGFAELQKALGDTRNYSSFMQTFVKKDKDYGFTTVKGKGIWPSDLELPED